MPERAAHTTHGQRHIVALYAATYCVTFMSELGHAFNRADAPPVDQADVSRLYHLLDHLLAQVR